METDAPDIPRAVIATIIAVAANILRTPHASLTEFRRQAEVTSFRPFKKYIPPTPSMTKNPSKGGYEAEVHLHERHVDHPSGLPDFENDGRSHHRPHDISTSLRHVIHTRLPRALISHMIDARRPFSSSFIETPTRRSASRMNLYDRRTGRRSSDRTQPVVTSSHRPRSPIKSRDLRLSRTTPNNESGPD